MMDGKARIMVLRSGLGDIIMSTPISRGAKKKFPNCHVTYAVPTDYAGGDLVALLENNPFIDEVIDYKIANRDDYDAFTDITRTGLQDEKANTIPPNRIDLFANACGIPLFGNYQPVYIMTEEERAWGKGFVERATRGKKYRGLISIHLGSRDPKRSWPHHRIREFIGLAKKSGYFCFLYEWGATSNDWRLAGSEQVFDFRLREAAAVMYATDVLVCPDSMMLHLAGALNFKTVSLFGNMPPACRINHYPNAVAVVNQQIGCLGCIYAPCSNNFYCMSSILPEAVLVAVRQRIDSELIAPQQTTEEAMVKPGVFTSRTINTFTI
jgi:ADP-heptose:LPS heptosyltransferase